MTRFPKTSRLRRLVTRGRFEEALTFARNFNLEVQEVYLAKASGLMQELSTWADTKTELLPDKYQDWIRTLNSITDINFVVECCLKFAPKSVDQLRDSLGYARKRLNLKSSSNMVMCLILFDLLPDIRLKTRLTLG